MILRSSLHKSLILNLGIICKGQDRGYSLKNKDLSNLSICLESTLKASSLVEIKTLTFESKSLILAIRN